MSYSIWVAFFVAWEVLNWAHVERKNDSYYRIF